MKIDVTNEELILIVHALGVAGRQYSKMATETAGTAIGRTSFEPGKKIATELHDVACTLADIEVRLQKKIKQ